jgi:DNA-binding winged helix-turn-helix (wHTH) protein
MKKDPLRFGPFTLNAERGDLHREGKVTPLRQRAVALLQALLEAGGAPVTKAELMERAWPGTIVEDGNRTVRIGALRKALGGGEGGHDWITTVPRLGYRLLNAPDPGPVTNANSRIHDGQLAHEATEAFLFEALRASSARSLGREKAGISAAGIKGLSSSIRSPVFLTKDASGLVSGARSVFRAAATAVGA